VTNTQDESASGPQKSVTIDLDGEDLTVPDRDITPDEILTIAGLEPATHYLVRLRGKHQESLQGAGEVPLKVHEGEKFLSLSTGPTPTS
jgi:hypothetical protein